ncbi:MAG: calcium/sodium antiporter [Flavobacteriaceae bacterium]|nr:calcium/sodium antiporter [Flavobacteriaceae bacterium]
MSVLYFIIGLALLVFGGDFLVKAAVGLSLKLKLSKMVVGLTVVSFATSLPELIVSLKAALNGFSTIALSNVIGSNIANIGLVLGLTVIIAPMAVDKDFYKLNWPVMMLFSLLLYAFLYTGDTLSAWEGVLLLVLIVIYIWRLVYTSRKESKKLDYTMDVDDSLAQTTWPKILLLLLVGGIGLWAGSELLVDSAVEIARNIGVSERVIGLSLIAIGTSVPELAASIISAIKGEKAVSLGNLLGSNIFNIASVLGVTVLIKPITDFDPKFLSDDIFWMLAISFIVMPLAFMPKRFKLERVEGSVLFVAYAVYLYVAFQ